MNNEIKGMLVAAKIELIKNKKQKEEEAKKKKEEAKQKQKEKLLEKTIWNDFILKYKKGLFKNGYIWSKNWHLYNNNYFDLDYRIVSKEYFSRLHNILRENKIERVAHSDGTISFIIKKEDFEKTMDDAYNNSKNNSKTYRNTKQNFNNVSKDN